MSMHDFRQTKESINRYLKTIYEIVDDTDGVLDDEEQLNKHFTAIEILRGKIGTDINCMLSTISSKTAD